MSEQRFFENPFLDQTPNSPLVDTDSGQLLSHIKQKITENVNRLVQMFEIRVKSDSNASDYSVYTGVAGYAYLYLHLSQVFVDKQQIYLKEAQNYVEKALRLAKKNKGTFLCGTSGAVALAAVIYDKLSLKEKSVEMISRLIEVDVKHEAYDEMLYGRSGILYSLLFAKKSIDTQNIIDASHIRNTLHCILSSGQKTAQKECKGMPPLYYFWHDKAYIGAAHGFIGILCMLLECRLYLTNEEIEKLVKPTVDYVFKWRLKSGNYMSSVGSTSDRLIHWCHGATGAVYLFTLAYQVFGNETYLKEAESCCEVIWRRGLLTKGYGICHGTAGNAYAFLRIYQLTNNEKYLHRALKFAEWCFDYGKHGCRTADRPLSLFEGLAGTVYYLSDLIDPKSSRFPAFQIST